MAEDAIRSQAEQLKAFIREHKPGGCRLFSSATCDCLLCAVDALTALAARDPRPTVYQCGCGFQGTDVEIEWQCPQCARFHRLEQNACDPRLPQQDQPWDESEAHD